MDLIDLPFSLPDAKAVPFETRLDRLCALLLTTAAKADETAEIPAEAWAALHRSGLLRAPLPGWAGGDDLVAPERNRDLVTLLRRIGAADLSIGRLVEGHVNAVALVLRNGTSEQIQSLATAVDEGALSGVWGADDAVGLSMKPVGSRWMLHGGKVFASGAGFVTHPVVIARSETGPRMVLPRLAQGERADVKGWTAQGMRSTATGSVDFTGMFIDADQLCGEPDAFLQQPHFSGGAWRFCAVHLGAAEHLVDLLRSHLTLRGRSADPYQIQRVSQVVAATTTASFWVHEAARRMADPTIGASDQVAFVNMTRMVTERAALDVLEAVHRGVGLQAFMRPHPIERVSRDLATYLRQPVPDLAMADAARAVLASQRATGDLWNAP